MTYEVVIQSDMARTAEQILMENPITYRVHSGSGKYYKFDLQAYKNNPKCIFWKLVDSDEEIANEMYIAPIVEEVKEPEEVVEEVQEEVIEEDTEVKDDVVEDIKEDNQEVVVEDYSIPTCIDGDCVVSTYENEDLGNKIQEEIKEENQEEKELIYEQVEELANEYAIENNQLKEYNKQLKAELEYYKELSKGLTESVKNPFANMTVKEFIKLLVELSKE